MKHLDIALMLAVTFAGVAYAATNGAGTVPIVGMFTLGFLTIAMSFGHKSRHP